MFTYETSFWQGQSAPRSVYLQVRKRYKGTALGAPTSIYHIGTDASLLGTPPVGVPRWSLRRLGAITNPLVTSLTSASPQALPTRRCFVSHVIAICAAV